MKHILTFLLAASLTCTAAAQSVITFEQKERKTSSFSNDGGKNALTLGILSSFNGYLPVYYERRLLDVMSIEVGAGPTFRSLGNDLGEIIYTSGAESDFFDDSYVGDTYYTNIQEDYANYDARESRLGIALSVAPKFYPGGYSLDGFHLGPVVEYKAYRYTTRVADPSVQGNFGGSLPSVESDVLRGDATFSESVNCLDLTLQIGGMYQSQSHLAIGWGFSFGVRRLNASRLDMGIVANNLTGDSYYRNEVREYSGIRPLLLFDLKLGGWF